MFEYEEARGEVSPWPVFGDLMACLFGLFVLFFVWAIAWQVQLASDLDTERSSRQVEQARLHVLERALAVPLAQGRISLQDGRIGIGGSVLFELSSAELSAEGEKLLRDLVGPLRLYLDEREDEMLMISGFTDDLPVRYTLGFRDNWELSVQRAVTVTRALTAAGVPSDRIFAAGFGAEHPVVENSSDENRARNRRVEIAPVPRHRTSP